MYFSAGFSRIVRACFHLPLKALYIKSFQAASPRTSRLHEVLDDEAAPVVSVHRTLLGGELAHSGVNRERPLPQRASVHQSGENQGQGWRRLEKKWTLGSRLDGV
jgi:hypothetical protein